MKHNRIGFPTIYFNAEGGGGAGDTGAADTGATGGNGTPAAPENILFPNEGKGDQQQQQGGEQKPDQLAGDWKEYQDDPAKSAEENARLKAEHDKTKPADDKNKDDPANKVPEDGKYELKMPDGVELDAELASALGPEFKDLGLTNAQAQKLVDKYIAIQQQRGEKQAENWSTTIQEWADNAKADKEIGGVNWDKTVNNAQRAVKELGSDALKEYLNASGGGNHPEVIRFMAKVGAMIKEDNPAKGGAEGAGKPVDPAHILFPNDAPKG